MPTPTLADNNMRTQYAFAAKSLLQSLPSHSRNTIDWAIADSGATSHFLMTSAPVIVKETASSPLSVKLPNGDTLRSTHTCQLDIPALPTEARLGHIIPGLANHSLISIVQLCNSGCEVKFIKEACHVIYNGHVIMRGRKCQRTGLWMLPVAQHQQEDEVEDNHPTPTIELMANVYETSTQADLAQYLHQCLFSPTPATLIKAIKNDQLLSFPGLTADLITKHLPPSTATAKGHMHQSRQGIRSTRPKPVTPSDPQDMNPDHQPQAAHHIYCFAALADLNSGTIYTDLTGRFPVRSYKGMQYIFVCYEYASNSIHVRPMKSREDANMVETFKNIYGYLKSKNFTPILNVMDNECSKAVLEFIESTNAKIQFVPPDIHRVNAAERAIRTFKEHFIAGLCTVDKMFPLQLWDELLEQAQDSLNLLRTARVNPKLSAYAILEGQFNFNKTPLAPPGTQALVYTAPNKRESWEPHAKDGWYVGPAKLHYRCYRFYMPETRAFRIAQTAKFFPTHCKMPRMQAEDAIIIAARDLVETLRKPHPKAPLNLNPQHSRALRDLSNIFQNAIEPVTPPEEASPRVDTPATRVDHTSPRVEPATSSSPTAPEVYKKQKQVHQRHTRSNTPMPAIFEEDKNDEVMQQWTNTQQHVTIPKTRQHVPTVPTVTQEDDEQPPQPRRSMRFMSPNIISQHALHYVIGRALETNTLESVPTKLMNDKFVFSPEIDLEQFCGGVVHPTTQETITKYEKLIASPELRAVWIKAMSKELHRLAQGFDDIEGTNTIHFMSLDEIKNIPADRTVTYARIVVDYRPQKEDPNRVRITVGGNLIDYPGELTTRTAGLTTTKILWNSVLSTPGAKYMCADIKNFYLETPLDRFEYMRMRIALIPEDIIEHYNLRSKEKNGYVYLEIRKGMYGLPQSGILANKLLKKRLATAGYYELPHTPGLWKHVTRPIAFTLVVDDFGIRYVGDEHARHLCDALKKEYTIEEDWTGGLYCGIKLSWDYEKRILDIAMPTYVHKQLVKYNHPTPRRPQHCPFNPLPIQYGKSAQEPAPIDDSPRLDAKGKQFIQQVVGSFQYYARAIDSTALMALSEIASAQAAPTEHTMRRTKQFLDYMATHPNAVIRYRASDMVLNVHSDASYLTAPNARSRAGGHFFLGNLPVDGRPIYLNGAIHTICSILKIVAASAAEAELGALFLNAREAKVLRLALTELGHPQPPIPIHIDNTTTVGIVNNTIKRQRSRAMEMRYFWLLDAEAQRLFSFRHQPGQENLGDYHSKNHTGPHHTHVRPYYVHENNSPQFLLRARLPSARRGCVGTVPDPYLRRNPLPRIPIHTRALPAPAA